MNKILGFILAYFLSAFVGVYYMQVQIDRVSKDAYEQGRSDAVYYLTMSPGTKITGNNGKYRWEVTSKGFRYLEKND